MLSSLSSMGWSSGTSRDSGIGSLARVGHPEELDETVNHHVAPLGLGDEFGRDEIVAAGPLAGTALRPDRHDDGRLGWLVGGQVTLAGDENADVVGGELRLPHRYAGHLAVGGGNVADGEDAFLAHHLELRRDLQETVRSE